MKRKKTLVLGASLNPNKYSNIAIRRLINKNIETVAIGFREGKVFNVIIDTDKRNFKEVNTVTLYLNPKRQEEYYNYIISLKPERVIFNPGTENTEFMNLSKEKGIDAEIACTLVMLSTNQF